MKAYLLNDDEMGVITEVEVQEENFRAIRKSHCTIYSDKEDAVKRANDRINCAIDFWNNQKMEAEQKLKELQSMRGNVITITLNA